jgi:transaldolase
MNALKKLQEYGQSVYLDEISRQLIESGELDTLIERDGLRGVTSNPAIFEKAIAQSRDYDAFIASLARQGKGVDEVYEAVVIRDIQEAADKFRAQYDASEGEHGFVSLEVSPRLAFDSEGTVDEARRLWEAVARPNVFIKVPGTKAGLPAIRTLIGEGVNVNVTLLFGLPRYRAVAEAYLEGLEQRARTGQDLGVASVASFFLSRIDTMIDKKLDALAANPDESDTRRELAQELRGQVAIASAKQAYQLYREIVASERFEALRAKGARPQRLLWASTSTKDDRYSDVKYVEPLIGPETINTMPKETLDAYRDHGDPAPRLEQGLEHARRVLEQLAELGIELDKVTQALEDEGVDKFVRPFESLRQALKPRPLPRAQSPLRR